MAVTILASFPNSRIKPRPSTTVARTNQIPILDYTQPLTKVAAEDVNRTYMLLQNLSLSTALFYVYANETLIDPMTVATYGIEGSMLYNPNTDTLYQKQDNEISTNWTVVNIEDVGEVINQGQTASLDSPQSVYAAANSGAPVVPQVEVGVDLGSG